MNITKIEVQKNNKDRFNLYIDNEFSMGIDSATYVHFNLKKDMTLTQEKLDEIKHYDAYRRAINAAVQYLSYKKRTAKEVTDYLKKDDIPDETIQRVLKYCFDNKYIDHQDYALSLMNTMINTTDKGPEQFRQKLLEKGVEKDIVSHYYELYTAQMDDARMQPLIQKLMDKHSRKASKKMAQQKILQTLVQKGYNLNITMSYLEDAVYSGDDDVLQQELEKQVKRLSRRHQGFELQQKVTASLMRKGFNYEDILTVLKESGIADE